MAQIEWNVFAGDEAGGRTLSLLATWSGAAMSAALVGGLVVWGWQLTVRDVTGVPVIRAIEGPMRVAPSIPGGDRAAYQGLSVNRIAAKEEETPPAQLVLAPVDEDVTEADLEVAPPQAEVEREVAPAAIEEAPKPALAATDLAVAEALGLSSDDALVLSAEETNGGWPRPEPRPRLMAASFTPSSAPVDAEEIHAASLAAGTRLVQFGAYESADEAREAWDHLNERFSEVMVGKQPVVQPVEASGRQFWRLRAAGFSDLDDARRFCSALLARATECIPALVR